MTETTPEQSSSGSNILLIDLGASELVIGKSNTDTPMWREPAVYADTDEPLISTHIIEGLAGMAKERLFGSEAYHYKNVIRIHHFLADRDYSSFIMFLKRKLESNYMDPRDYALVFILPSYLLPRDLERLKLECFQKLGTPKIAFIPAAMCVLTALGKDTGVIVDIGFQFSSIDSLFKGFPNEEANIQLPLGGSHVTQYLTDLLFARNRYQSGAALEFIAEDVKQMTSFCAQDPSTLINSILQGNKEYDQSIELPDGSTLIVNTARFECCELFFEPERAHLRSLSIIDALEKSIRAWDRHQIADLVANIILCGHGSAIPGLKEKIEYLIRSKFSSNLQINLIAPEQRKDIFWIGGAILYAKKKGNMDWIANPNPMAEEGCE
jgi:actin-related protein